MSDRIEVDYEIVGEIGRTVCPDIANFYDDIGSKAATAGRSRGSAFGDHGLADVWNDMFNLFYDVVHETGQNIRALGPTLVQIATDLEVLEGELVQTFGEQEAAIEQNGYSSTPSANFEDAPTQAPDPEHKDENPYADQLADGDQPV
ncbi:hypothetical protein [Glycomyces tarimensis]